MAVIAIITIASCKNEKFYPDYTGTGMILKKDPTTLKKKYDGLYAVEIQSLKGTKNYDGKTVYLKSTIEGELKDSTNVRVLIRIKDRKNREDKYVGEIIGKQ